jgi:hypothetical protein
LDYRTLINEHSNQNDAAALEQGAKFENLDGSLQTFINAYARGQADLQALLTDQLWATKALITAKAQDASRQIEGESHKIREHFTSTQAAAQSRQEHEAKRRQLLESLDDQAKNARRNQIEESHSETFSWVFNDEIQRPWDSFTEWLSCKDPTYWICGKAGSGKSTLVKFLVDHERTQQCLNEWAPDCSIYSHFIWNSGTELQRSITGFLRSLLFQLFEANTYIMDDLMKNWSSLSRMRHPSDWSNSELEKMVLEALQAHSKGICIFIDGLDEIDQIDGPFGLLNLIERISAVLQAKSLKFCVSSRPENAFKLRLGSCPKLRLQDLTMLDIEVYAKDFVENKCSFDLSGIDERDFIKEIVTKANGVFLWVSLALKSLQRGVANRDDPAKLMERLRKLPSELGKLYEEMLKRLGDDDHELYSEEAAMIFNTFILMSELQHDAGRSWNLLHYAIAFDSALREEHLKAKSTLPLPILKKTLLAVDAKLNSRCAGILEVVSAVGGRQDIAHTLMRDGPRSWDPIGVDFLHRSAKEFLLSSRKDLLDQDPISAAERKFRVLQATILDSSYPPRDLVTGRGRNKAMYIMSRSRPFLSNEQELEILDLLKEIYERNGWPEFYENAAHHGFQQPLAHLFEASQGDIGPLGSYLLLSALLNNIGIEFSTVSYLLEMGSYSGSSVALAPIEIHDKSSIYILMPLLGHFIRHVLLIDRKILLLVENMIRLFVGIGADLEARFLDYELGTLRLYSVNPASRPYYQSYKLGRDGLRFLVERNCVDIIFEVFLGCEKFSPAERLAIASRLGLDISRARHKVLLYFHGDSVYGADDEDSDALNDILGWPESRLLALDGHNTSLLLDNATSSNSMTSSTEDKNEAAKLLQVLKGKEVDDVEKWLVDRGYALASESDIEGISDQATVYEMAAIYQKLGEKYAQRRRK